MLTGKRQQFPLTRFVSMAAWLKHLAKFAMFSLVSESNKTGRTGFFNTGSGARGHLESYVYSIRQLNKKRE